MKKSFFAYNTYYYQLLPISKYIYRTEMKYEMNK